MTHHRFSIPDGRTDVEGGHVSCCQVDLCPAVMCDVISTDIIHAF